MIIYEQKEDKKVWNAAQTNYSAASLARPIFANVERKEICIAKELSRS